MGMYDGHQYAKKLVMFISMIQKELKEINYNRSNGTTRILSDFTEAYACYLFGLNLAKSNNEGHDCIDDKTKETYEVKYAVLPENKSITSFPDGLKYDDFD